MKFITLIAVLASSVLSAAQCTSAVANGNACSAATWANCGGGIPAVGMTATVALHFPVDVPAGCTLETGTSPVSGGTAALTTNDAITVEGGIILHGPWVMGAAPPTFNAGSFWYWDASLASSPMTTNYAASCTSGKRVLTINGTATSHVTVGSNPLGGNGTINPASSSCLELNAQYVDFVSVGDAVNPALYLSSGSDNYINTLRQATFDANSGALNVGASLATGGWDLEDIWFNQTDPTHDQNGTPRPLMLGVGVNAPSTAIRRLYRASFSQFAPSGVKPYLSNSGSDIQDPFFPNGWTDNRFARSYAYSNWSGGFIREPKTGGTDQLEGGSMTDVVFVWDSTADPSYSGTMTSADATHFTDTTQSFSGISPGGSTNYYVETMSGTGVGQRRYIKTSTPTTVTIATPWTITPDATTGYVIVRDSFNPHGLEGGLGNPVNFTGLVFEDFGTDGQGDCLLHLSGNRVYNISGTIVLPNGLGSNSCDLMTNFGTEAQPGTQNVFHNTAFGGSQSMVTITEGGSGTAHSVGRIDSNLFLAALPGGAYYGSGGNGPGYLATAGAAGKPISQTTLDIVVPGGADFNACFGCKTTGYNGGGAYNFNWSTQPGPHDQNVDPELVGCPNYGLTVPVYTGSSPDADAINYCNFRTWATGPACGSTSLTMRWQIADGLQCLYNDPTLARTSYLPFIRAGYEVQNPYLLNAGLDGITIGAEPEAQ